MQSTGFSTPYVREKIKSSTNASWDASFQKIARQRRDDLAPVLRIDPGPLLDFIPKTSPKLKAPTWFGPVVDAFERSIYERVLQLFSSPPQHGKSELCFHFLAWALKKNPALKILYLTYSEDFALTQMRRAKPIAEAAGVDFAPGSKSFTQWYTTAGGMLSANGMLGAVTGKPADIIVIDDPFKDWVEAHSSKRRQQKMDWLRSVVISRMQEHTSLIIFSTRWHEDDVHGQLEKEPGFTSHNFEAINDSGEALAPEVQSAEFLQKQRDIVGELIWWALWMGKPRPIGGEIFGEATYCDLADIPTAGKDSIGIDLAYTAKTSSDWSICLTLRKHRLEDLYYIVNAVAKQKRAEDFAEDLKGQAGRFPGVKMIFRCSGVEQGAAGLIRRMHNIPIVTINASNDKLVNSMKVAAAWNAGKILVPRDAPWTAPLVAQVTSFTGVGDTNDDYVDGLGNAFEGFSGASSGKVDTIKRGRTRALRGAF